MTDLRDALAEVLAKSVSVGNPELRAITRTVDAILTEFVVVPIGDAKPSIQPWLDAERLTYEAIGDGAAVEIGGKRIEDCDEYGQTATTRDRDALARDLYAAGTEVEQLKDERDTAYAEVERMMTDRRDLRATLDRVRDMARWVDTVPADDVEAVLDAAAEPAANLHVGDDAATRIPARLLSGAHIGRDVTLPDGTVMRAQSIGHDDDDGVRTVSLDGDRSFHDLAPDDVVTLIGGEADHG